MSEDPDTRSESADDSPWELSRMAPAEAEELRAAWQSYSDVIAELEDQDAALHPAPPDTPN
jgi:hypothetical protein